MLPELQNYRHYHFIAIGGVGMSALAHILLDQGYRVSGSDIAESALTAQLQGCGAAIHIGHAAVNLPAEAEAVVVSSAIRSENPELLVAKERGIPIFHRSDINAALLNAAQGIAVAGAHGKTTTTSMLAVALATAGADPTAIVGGVVRDFGSNARLGRSGILVSEADESDGSFLKLRPHIAVVTNVEDDHLDHYGTVEAIEAAFLQFIQNLDPAAGRAVVCFDNPAAKRIALAAGRRIISYAIDDPAADYRAADIETEAAATTFAVLHKGEPLGEVSLQIPGFHNVRNALATIAAARALGLDFASVAAGLQGFMGAKRRFEKKGEIGGITVVDDYAHHPTETAAALKAGRQTKPRRLVAVFQPHRYSRTQLLANEFGAVFDEADILFLTGIYAAGEAPIAGVSGRLIYDAVNFHKRSTMGFYDTVIYKETLGGVVKELTNMVMPGDLVMTIGAGDVYKAGEEFLKLLERK